MSKIIFNGKQIKNLLENPNVLRCSNKSITYSRDFKINAVELYKQGLNPQEIFVRAGFDLNIIGRGKPKNCLRRWNKVFKEKGLSGLSEARGRKSRGRPKRKNLTDKEKIKELELEIAYLKKERDFLAELRAKRAESNSGLSKNSR